MDLIAITICVNYSDILQCMIQQNCNFFKKWFIITSPEDTQTIKIIEVFRKFKKFQDILEILIYDNFYTGNGPFNKGGALRFAQNHVEEHYENSNILILDADIYLPDDFLQKMPEIIPHTLYRSAERLDFHSINDFVNNVNPHPYKWNIYSPGCFQLYKQDIKYKYCDSQDCSHCDTIFKDLFENNGCLEITIKHLGEEGVNWTGRKWQLV